MQADHRTPVDAQALEAAVTTLFERCKMDHADAQLLVRSLVEADLRGVYDAAFSGSAHGKIRVCHNQGHSLALANRPQVILADEPTGELDTATGRELIALLAHVVAAEGVTLIVATHDAAVTAAAHLVYHIADGRVHAVEAAQPPA